MNPAAAASVPVLLNKSATTAKTAFELLQHDSRFSLRPLQAQEMPAALDELIAEGVERVIVCGGDGTLNLAAGRLAGTSTALAVIPGGNLNHFAERHGIPTDPAAAADFALSAPARALPVGYVNDQLFLNTSSLGAYARFLATRQHFERSMNYHLATLLAGVRRLIRLRSAWMAVEDREVRTPLVFIAVDERDIQLPWLGRPKQRGQPGLHLIAMYDVGRWQTLRIAFNALVRGIDPLARARQMHSEITDKLVLNYRRRSRHVLVAVDGELVRLQAPLIYRYQEKGLTAVVPEPTWEP